MLCWLNGRTATGTYSSNRWFLVHRVSDGYEAFIHSSYIPAAGQPGGQITVGNCANSWRVEAALQAIARFGQWQPSASDVQLGGWTLYGPTSNPNAFGPDGDWSGDCAKFAWVAYERAGKQLAKGGAWAMFSTYYSGSYSARGRNTLPAYGALVGWDWNPGHIAIAIGGSYVATTLGLDNAKLNNTDENLAASTSFGGTGFYGWVVPK